MSTHLATTTGFGNTGFGRRGFLMLGAASVAAIAAYRPAWADDTAAAAPIQRLNATLLASMKAGSSITFAQRMAMVQPVVEQTFDLPKVLQESVGLTWSGLSASQKASLLAAFQRYTAANYAANFDSYSNQRFQILPQERVLPDGRVVVETQIGQPGGTPHTIDYVMQNTADGWKAVDVLADGSISRVAVQRSDFSSALASGGAPRLAERLTQVTTSLAGGASGSAATYG